MVAEMGHGCDPSKRGVVTFGDYLLQLDLDVRKSSDKGAINRFECFRTDNKPVCIGKAEALRIGMHQAVNRSFVLLVPDLLEPLLGQGFIRFRHGGKLSGSVRRDQDNS